MSAAKNLEIGCGSNPQPGYLHTDLYVDGSNRGIVDVICDAQNLPFSDSDFDNVLMFGVFEHLGYFEAQKALLEVSRVLKTGGLFRFDVPDFDWFVHAYLTGKDKYTGAPLESRRDEMWVMKSIFGGQDGPGMFHKWGWNQTRIEEMLRRPNFEFSDIRLVGRQWRDPEENHLIYDCVRGQR